MQELQHLSRRLLAELGSLPLHHLLGWRADSRPREPGASPGTLFLATTAPPTRIRATRCGAGAPERLETDDPAELATMLDGRGWLWVDVTGFGDAVLLRSLAEHFRIHPLVLADAVNTPQRAKAERYADQRLIITHLPQLDQETGEPSLGQLTLMLGEGFLVTLREHPGDQFAPLYERLETPGSRLSGNSPDYLAYAVLDLATDSFFPAVESLSEQIADIEEEVMNGNAGDLLVRMHIQRRGLILLGRILRRHRDMIAQLLRSDELFAPDLNLYLRDVHDHSLQLLDMVETGRELAASLVEIHLSAINNRLNQVMKTLTIIASIFIPLTFLAGIYGMNFEFMPELAWPWAYPAVLGLMFIVAVGLVLWFYRRGWIELGGAGRSEKDA